jgi:hypothetical protein
MLLPGLMRAAAAAAAVAGAALAQDDSLAKVGREVAIEKHLADGDELQMSAPDLIDFGRKLFKANWTIQEGGGRPLSKGTGDPVSDSSSPLRFPRGFNRISGPEANSCAGCHNTPIAGGSGDLVANVFVLGQRFDFATFSSDDRIPTRGAIDEIGRPVTLQSIANSRVTVGMFGSGYIEMLSRQMTADLQSLRDGITPGGAKALVTKGISFGTLARTADGSWDTSKVEGLSPLSIASTGPNDPPSLIIRPFHQAGRVVSLREFTNNAFNHHHGMQSTERFGVNTDPDGDGVMNELTRADITAAVLFQAALAVPGRVLPSDGVLREAARAGEKLFGEIGCANCHVPSLPLDRKGWIFTEPNPYNPSGNLQLGDAPLVALDLSRDDLPQPRLKPDSNGVIQVPAFTDLKLHDICAGADDPNVEILNMQAKPGTDSFFAGNRNFITRKLWGFATDPAFFHHGMYTTIREAILAHSSEALSSRTAFQSLSSYEQGAIIEFLKTLQVLPEGNRELMIDARRGSSLRTAR